MSITSEVEALRRIGSFRNQPVDPVDAAEFIYIALRRLPQLTYGEWFSSVDNRIQSTSTLEESHRMLDYLREVASSGKICFDVWKCRRVGLDNFRRPLYEPQALFTVINEMGQHAT